MHTKIILASASPRRRELLYQIGITPEIIVSEADETVPEEITGPAEAAAYTAGKKADAVAAHLFTLSDREEAVILAADTVVACGGEILGKPKDADDAFRMLSLLSGRTHTVSTGVALLLTGKAEGKILRRETFSVSTKVTVFPLDKDEILSYIATGDPFDKAGAYGIQGRFARHIGKIEGDYFTVVGLPCAEVYRHLKAWDVL